MRVTGVPSGAPRAPLYAPLDKWSSGELGGPWRLPLNHSRGRAARCFHKSDDQQTENQGSQRSSPSVPCAVPVRSSSSALAALTGKESILRRLVGLFVGLLVVLTIASGAATAGSSAPTRATTTAASAAKVRVPRVVGYRMDRATRTLRNARLRVNEECSGLFGCIVKSRWWVCVQSPRAGRYVPQYSVVVIYAERRGEC